MSNKQKYSVLFVDDEPRITTALKAIFRREYAVYIANSGDDVLAILEHQQIDVVVSDQRMPQMLGNELLAEVSRRFPRTMRVLLTGFTDKQAIIDSINQGEIYRFISKPWNNDELREVVADAALASEVHFQQDQQPQVAEQAVSKDQLERALVMMENSSDVRNQLRRIGRDQALKIYATPTAEQTVAAGSARNTIGVAVIELSENIQSALAAIHALKRIRPDIVTVALADEYDAQIAIDLINQGQVYKYLSKPLSEQKLTQIFDQAFHRHQWLKHNQPAQRRYKVEHKSGRVVTGLQQMFSRLVKNSPSPLQPSSG